MGSSYINRFIQPDTLIPSPANPQSLNRYGYVLNSPVNFNDPTGHMCSDPDDPTPSCDGANKVGEKSHGGGNPVNRHSMPIRPRQNRDRSDSELSSDKVVNPPAIGPTCAFCGDATLISFSYSAGQDTSYVTYGFDIVITDDEIGVFSVNGKGSGFGKQGRDPRLPLREMNRSYMFPQVGATIYFGKIWGESLQESVLSYEGPSKVKGLSIGPVSGEYFETVDKKTGMPNGDISGFALGGGFSLFQYENHSVFTDATPIFSFGY